MGWFELQERYRHMIEVETRRSSEQKWHDFKQNAKMNRQRTRGHHSG